MNVSSAIGTVKSIITANSPVLLVGTAVAGVITTGILAARGGYKARGIIDEAEAQSGHDLNTQEKVQLTWLCYAAPALTGASTIASVVGVHTIHTKRHAALAGLYAVTTSKLDDYRDKAEELLGPKKAQQLNDEVAQKVVDREEDFENAEVMMIGDGGLCYDEYSGRWFKGSVNKIEAAILSVNKKLLDDGDASLNDYYDAVGLPPIPMGSELGWSGPATVEARFGAVRTPDGQTATSAWFQTSPTMGFEC